MVKKLKRAGLFALGGGAIGLVISLAYMQFGST